MTKPSRQLVEAVKRAGRPAYKIAIEAELHPSTLSQLIIGAIPTKPDDSRLIRVGAVLGLQPEDCFENSEVAAK